MGLFDNVEGAAENMAGQGLEDKLIAEGTQKAEQFADQQTGGRFDSQIQQAGNFADQQIEQRMGGQGQGQGQGQSGQGFGQSGQGQGQSGQGQGQGQSQQQGGW